MSDWWYQLVKQFWAEMFSSYINKKLDICEGLLKVVKKYHGQGMCLRLKIEMKGNVWTRPFPERFLAALKCVVFVGLHLAVRLVPSQLKMKMGEGAVNPHKNIFLRMRSCGSSNLSAYWLVVWLCRVNLTCQDNLIPSTSLISEHNPVLS